MDTYPFLPASFLTPETVQLVIHSNTILYGFQIVHLLLVIVFLFYVAKDILRHKLRNISTAKTFFLLSFFISAAIAFLLAWLSVFVAKEEILPGYFWTYVEEARYYGLIYILAQLSLFIFYRKLLARPFLKLVFYVLILFLSVEMLRGVFFDARRIALLQKEEYSWQYEDRFQKYADKIIREGQQKYNVKKTVVTGSMYFMNHRVSLYSHVPLLYASLSINDITSLKASEPILVLVILHRKSFQDYQPFLAQKKNEVAGKFDGFYFYTVYVRPH